MFFIFFSNFLIKIYFGLQQINQKRKTEMRMNAVLKLKTLNPALCELIPSGNSISPLLFKCFKPSIISALNNTKKFPIDPIHRINGRWQRTMSKFCPTSEHLFDLIFLYKFHVLPHLYAYW